MPQEKKMELFDIRLMMVEQNNPLHSTQCVRGFLWHTGLQSQLDAVAYLLSEPRNQTTGGKAGKMWL
jgi:hypothetical protein